MLKDAIQDDMKAAMRARETQRLSAIRLLIAALKQREIDERIQLDDAGVVAVVEKLIKQRRDSAEQYEQAGRAELAAKERFEIDVLSAYLPRQADEAEIEAAISAAFDAVKPSGPAQMGQVMGLLKQALAGRADMAALAARVRARLTAS
ncbi:MAG: GatB/YqeY domain-containing protein [Burkholderiaceae bacterium]